MATNHRPTSTLLLSALTALFVLGLSQLDNLSFWGVKPKKIDILSDIRFREERKTPDLSKIPDDRIAETTLSETDFKPRSIPEIKREEVLPVQDFGGGNGSGLEPFHRALTNMKNGEKIRIAWFGDSTIEGDLISQDVRKNLQDIFGGSGIGYVPITSVVSKFRNNVQHNFSDNWKTYSFSSGNPYPFPLGISGFVFIPAQGKYEAGDAPTGNTQCWVEYATPSEKTTFESLRLFYGYLEGTANLHLSTDGGNYTERSLAAGVGIHGVSLIDRPVKKAKIYISADAPLAVYGAFIENNEGGIYIDNYALRGSNGINLNQIKDEVWRAFNSQLHYKLIILQYGANIADPGATSFAWYEKGLSQIIARLKELFPDAGILVIGAPDKSIHSEQYYVTNPAIPMILKAQRRAAEKMGVAFWNLFDAMGGENSMPVWVERKLAAPDYTHLSGKGAREIAKRITKAILYEFAKAPGK